MQNYLINKLNVFFRVYFIISFILICTLITNRLNLIENQSNEPHISCKYSVDQLLEYQQKLFNSFDLKCNCDSKLKVSLESVQHLRRSESTAQEIFNYLSITLNKTNSLNEEIKARILSEVSDRKNVILLELEKLNQKTGLNSFKTQRLEWISNQIKSKIYKLQNVPAHFCSKIPKRICKISVDAGFASGIHQILWCFVSAFYKNQIVVLIPEWTKYFGRSSDVWERIFTSFFKSRSREGWNDIFLPLSTTCDYKNLSKSELNIEETPNTVIHRKLMNELPKMFGNDLISLVESPNSWFHSQFIGYILRPHPRLEKFIEEFKQKIHFKRPIVGVQVRRTDKISFGEALYYPISDYMIHINDFYDKMDLIQKINERRVYVSSDDPSVLFEFKKKFPDYVFIGSTSNAEMAFSQSTRYSNSSLWGVLSDIFMLSETDYIVCTFSSAICRLSYQLMRFKQKDSSFQYRSLDVPFHYHHSLTPVRTVLYNHFAKSSDQWTLKIGDHLHERIRGRFTEWFDQAINGRGWDSYFFASNSSKHKFYKLYPIYKVYDDIQLI